MTDSTHFEIGQSASISKIITETDIHGFAEITGDKNPVHLDEEYAKGTIFGGRIAHGMLSAGLISAVLAMKLPGPGAIYQEQTLSFLAPVRIGDTITSTVEIVEFGKKKRSAKFQTTCINQDGVMVVKGFATIMLPRPK